VGSQAGCSRFGGSRRLEEPGSVVDGRLLIKTLLAGFDLIELRLEREISPMIP